MCQKAPTRILTIGYEGASLDVRELPNSRRRGFSKSALSAALREAGIEYSHERALGSPREMRRRLRKEGDLERFFGDFCNYLATQQTLLDAVARSAGSLALLCYERNPAECHRSVVAAALARRAKCPVRHLMVPVRS
jgi:uncharacterized protein (DUF488 family)